MPHMNVKICTGWPQKSKLLPNYQIIVLNRIEGFKF